MKSFSIKIYLLILLSLLLTGCGYTRLFRMEENIQMIWNNCEDSFETRDELIGEFLQWIKSNGYPVNPLVQRVELRRAAIFNSTVLLTQQESLQNYLSLQQELLRDFSMLKRDVLHWDGLQKDWQFQEILRHMEENNSQVVERLDQYSAQMKDYQTFMEPVYRRVFAHWLGFGEFQTLDMESDTMILSMSDF